MTGNEKTLKSRSYSVARDRLGRVPFVLNNEPGSVSHWRGQPAKGIRSESKKLAVYEEPGMKVPAVNGIRPETARSIPG